MIALAVPSTSASASSTSANSESAREEPRYEVKNRATSRCLDSNSQGTVYTLACNGGNYQRWLRTRPPFNSSVNWGQVWLKNVATGRCLATNSNGDAYTVTCPTKDNNSLEWEVGSATTYIMSHPLKTCLDSDSTGWTHVATCNKGDFQTWYLR
ncbi:ricin-type beta-trefoil lectin domain protein [Actinoplanes sp. NPDC048988]